MTNMIRCMHLGCWMTATDTHTHTEYLILTAFPWQQGVHKHICMLHLKVHFLLVTEMKPRIVM